jgi:hypothetical protein
MESSPQTMLAPALSADPDFDSSPVTLARSRLELSRTRLRGVLLKPLQDVRGEQARPGGGFWPEAWQQKLSALTAKLHEHPLASVVVDTVSGWWRQNPWRQVAELAGEQARERVLPWVRRNALGVIVAAFAGGAALAILRPWRWRAVSQQLRPVPTHLGRWALAGLASLPLQSLLTATLLIVAGKMPQGEGTTVAVPDTAPNAEKPVGIV